MKWGKALLIVVAVVCVVCLCWSQSKQHETQNYGLSEVAHTQLVQAFASRKK